MPTHQQINTAPEQGSDDDFVAGACAAVVGEVVVGKDDGWVVVVGGLLIVGEGVLNSNKSSVLVKCDAGKFPRFGHT
jgi:hypothetical protein